MNLGNGFKPGIIGDKQLGPELPARLAPGAPGLISDHLAALLLPRSLDSLPAQISDSPPPSVAAGAGPEAPAPPVLPLAYSPQLKTAQARPFRPSPSLAGTMGYGTVSRRVGAWDVGPSVTGSADLASPPAPPAASPDAE